MSTSIAATPGIDCLFVGPYDLRYRAERRHGAGPAFAPEVERAIDTMLRRRDEGRQDPGPSIAATPSARVAMAKRGFRFLAVGSDLGFLREGTAAQLKALK